jgi:dTDP-4-dehydrorhamnose 3,5-epimerase
LNITETFISGPLVITPQIFCDDRGYFFEPYNKPGFINIGIKEEFLQDNQSMSGKGVLRGLHFQVPPYAQAKLVRVIKGSALDVAVDIRKNSKTYGKYFSIILSEQNNLIFWIPEGFAHGFLSLEENTIFSYKCTNVYHKESERSLLWNDPDIGIDWEYVNPVLSDKDRQAPLLRDFISPF